jgi:hypothetical protein
MLYLFVEGDNDKDFFRNIFAHCLIQKFIGLTFWSYAQETNEKINAFINSINSIDHYDYLFIADKDNFPCITSCIDSKLNKIKSLNQSKVFIVEREIESWYLSGLDEQYRIDNNIRLHRSTDDFSKEQFNNLIPERLNRYEFMFDIFDNFDLNQAIRRNSSLRYFHQKFCY